MLQAKTPAEVLELINTGFSALENFTETVGLSAAVGRVVAEDIGCGEYIPGFNRSTVDGFAVRASDTFGCSEAIPAILPVTGEVFMDTATGEYNLCFMRKYFPKRDVKLVRCVGRQQGIMLRWGNPPRHNGV